MKRIYLIATALSALAFSSCRYMGDDLVSYGQDDAHAFTEAEVSFAGQFNAIWHAMNENYGIWDYEEAHGLNWDDVYTTYLPKFEALDDTTVHKAKVTNDELRELYEQFMDSLHDGHLALQIKNLHTGKRFYIVPSSSRNTRERGKAHLDEKQNITDLTYYSKLAPGDRYYAGGYDATSSTLVAVEEVDSVCSRIIRAADKYIQLVDNNGGPNATNDSVYEAVKQLKFKCKDLIDDIDDAKTSKDDLKLLVDAYNLMCSHYEIIGMQLGVDMPLIADKLAKDDLEFIHSAVFNGGIAYLRFGGFSLSSYLDSRAPADKKSLLYTYHQAVNRVWSNWFDTIQSLHAKGQLGGVIIDLRNNPGGFVSDYKFVLGALLPSGGYNSHYLRVKEGFGRLDFAPIVPFTMPTYDGQHAVITEQPIVVLANSRSVSMAEITTWGVKTCPNGYFIGTRTWGGLSALNDDPSFYSQTYSGGFGVENETSFYGYVPRFISLFGDDKRILEGVGITPDKEVPLDINAWKTNRTDNQLEAALEYIRTR